MQSVYSLVGDEVDVSKEKNSNQVQWESLRLVKTRVAKLKFEIFPLRLNGRD